ncbi:lymphocyte function-associated antigen 3-like [Salminus brasiliensis]|uniref:lymphocyte function-associated antigen 3-like n=1 Tax=Salminus brasiliensis TaxID=930266 RepID=UPI003B839E22
MVNVERRHFCLLFVLFSAGHVCGTEYVETGKDYTFTPTVTGVMETILWKFRNNKVVEFEFKDTTWYRFGDRGHLDTGTGKLTLMNMMKNESGLYQSEIQVNGKLHNTAHDLVVMDGVSEPKVICDVFPEGITLSCSVPNPVMVEYDWSGPDRLTYTGQTLNVSKKTSLKSVYFCTAKNKVSKKTTQFSIGSCYPPPVPVGLIIGVVAAILIILVVIAVIYKYREKFKNCFPVSTK